MFNTQRFLSHKGFCNDNKFFREAHIKIMALQDLEWKNIIK